MIHVSEIAAGSYYEMCGRLRQEIETILVSQYFKIKKENDTFHCSKIISNTHGLKWTNHS